MKIAQIVSGSELNGAVQYAVKLSALLTERGHEVVLVHRPTLDLDAWRSKLDGVRMVPSTLRRQRREIQRIGRFCRDNGVEVVHTHMSSAHAFGACLRLFHRIPSVATAHKLNVQLHWAVNNRVICHNDESIRFQKWRNLVLSSRLRKVPAFVDDRDLRFDGDDRAARAALGIEPDDIALVTVGHVIPRKGLIDIVEALPAVVAVHPRVRLFVCAWQVQPDYQAQVLARAAALGVAERIRWELRLPQPELVRLLAAADLCVQASRVETGPAVVLEAMALGRPVVGTRCGSMPDYIVPGETGALAPVASPEALAAAILQVLADPERRRRMGRQGRARFAEHFSAAVNVPRIEAILHEAAARARP